MTWPKPRASAPNCLPNHAAVCTAVYKAVGIKLPTFGNVITDNQWSFWIASKSLQKNNLQNGSEISSAIASYAIVPPKADLQTLSYHTPKGFISITIFLSSFDTASYHDDSRLTERAAAAETPKARRIPQGTFGSRK